MAAPRPAEEAVMRATFVAMVASGETCAREKKKKKKNGKLDGFITCRVNVSRSRTPAVLEERMDFAGLWGKVLQAPGGGDG